MPTKATKGSAKVDAVVEHGVDDVLHGLAGDLGALVHQHERFFRRAGRLGADHAHGLGHPRAVLECAVAHSGMIAPCGERGGHAVKVAANWVFAHNPSPGLIAVVVAVTCSGNEAGF
jgi:hypothetical protein